MGYHLEFNCLLSVPSDLLDLKNMKAGEVHQITKEKERLYPLNIPIEICDENYQYYGKVAVRKLTLEAGKTTLEIEVLKIFSASEAAVYTNNFMKPPPRTVS
jgi:hypothetical protein